MGPIVILTRVTHVVVGVALVGCNVLVLLLLFFVLLNTLAGQYRGQIKEHMNVYERQLTCDQKLGVCVDPCWSMRA